MKNTYVTLVDGKNEVTFQSQDELQDKKLFIYMCDMFGYNLSKENKSSFFNKEFSYYDKSGVLCAQINELSDSVRLKYFIPMKKNVVIADSVVFEDDRTLFDALYSKVHELDYFFTTTFLDGVYYVDYQTQDDNRICLLSYNFVSNIITLVYYGNSYAVK